MTAHLAKSRLAEILPTDRVERMLQEQSEMCQEALNRWATDFPGSLAGN